MAHESQHANSLVLTSRKDPGSTLLIGSDGRKRHVTMYSMFVYIKYVYIFVKKKELYNF